MIQAGYKKFEQLEVRVRTLRSKLGVQPEEEG